jgi:hypothetical protein
MDEEANPHVLLVVHRYPLRREAKLPVKLNVGLPPVLLKDDTLDRSGHLYVEADHACAEEDDHNLGVLSFALVEGFVGCLIVAVGIVP